MHVERLVEMINQIEANWGAEPDHAVAVEGVRSHVRRFWEPRMRAAIIAHFEAGGAGLGPLALEAVKRIANEAKAA